ncbi:Fc.00g075090.m01.CDS01 [Cosmosporella sp. VM-42]
MGILFSRPGRDTNLAPNGTYPAGAASSINGTTIAPFLGINTGLYGDKSFSDLPPIPFEWIISPSSGHEFSSCPNGSRIMTTFGVAETVIALLTPLFAYRPFIHWATRGYLGRRVGSSVAVTWTIVIAFQLLANAIIAGMVGHTPGYGHLNMLHIFTVYIARPRFNFVVLGLLRSLVGLKRDRSWDKTNIIKKQVDERVEFPYADSYITYMLSEMLLLIISAIFTAVTWKRIPSDSKVREYMEDLVSYMSSAPAVMLLCAAAFVPIWKRYGDAFPVEGRRYQTGRKWGVTIARDGRATVGVKDKKRERVLLKRVASAVAGAVLMGFVCLVQWSYWTRFLSMPGVLFCPPKLAETGIVWAVFSLAGVLVGAAS